MTIEATAIPLRDAWKVREWFPRAIDFEIIAPSDWGYNCYAYAVGKNYWIGSFDFMESLDKLGYKMLPEVNIEVELGIEKVAVFRDDHGITHGSIQRRDGRWESKLGPGPLIIHNDLESISGGGYAYGKVWAVYARPCEVAA